MKGSDLFCDECENRMPELTEENQTLFECFTLCASQLRAAMEPFAMDWRVVVEVARAMGIKRNKIFFRFLRTFEAVLIESIKNKSKAEG